MRVRPSVAIVEQGKLLTMRYKFGGQDVFALPGGNPDPGEGMTTTICRELEEELSVTVNLGEVLLAGEVVSWGTREDVLHFVFSGRIEEGDVCLNPAHTTALEVVWLDCKQLAENTLYPNVGARLTEILSGGVPGIFMGEIDQPLY